MRPKRIGGGEHARSSMTKDLPDFQNDNLVVRVGHVADFRKAQFPKDAFAVGLHGGIPHSAACIGLPLSR